MTRSSRFVAIRRAAYLVVLLAIAAVVLFVSLKSPSHERNWKPEYAVLPSIEIAGETVAVSNVRNFTYSPDGNIRDVVYEDRVYDLGKLVSMWYGISHFSGFGLAHTFLSFGFAGGDYLVLSIEARQEVGESYHPVTGLLRNYELIYVLGDERDIIGLRTHIRDEDVYLYELKTDIEVSRRKFIEFLNDVNEIRDRPAFYNTLTDNCTTGLVRRADQLTGWTRLLDYRILLPGYSDELAYELGVIATDAPLADIRNRARIDPSRTSLDDPLFSEKIRGE